MTRVMNIIRKMGLRKPPPQERRLHKRAMLYWHALKRDREFVLLDAFDAVALEDRSTHGFLLDLTEVTAPVLRFIGPVLRDEASIKGKDVALSIVEPGSLLKRFADRFPEVLASRKPVLAEYDFVTSADYHVLCRGILLPLSSDGVQLDHVYGVISWKSEKVRG